MQSAAPDALFVEMVGADAVHFLTQWSQLGLKNKIPLIANETTTDQSNIRSIAPEIVEGITSFGHFAEGRDAPATRAFIDKYGKAEGVLPSYMATSFYTAAQWIGQAIDKVHGNTADVGTLLRAVREIKLADSPFGPMMLDQYGAPVENVYVRKVVATTGDAAKYAKTWNVVMKTYPRVSQFWTWSRSTTSNSPSTRRAIRGTRNEQRQTHRLARRGELRAGQRRRADARRERAGQDDQDRLPLSGHRRLRRARQVHARRASSSTSRSTTACSAG